MSRGHASVGRPRPVTPPLFLPGQTILEQYEVRALLGQGAMGHVYRALDRSLGVEVALKTMQQPEMESLFDLKAEFRARADLHHPNLLQLHDLVVTAEYAFFTMALVQAAREFPAWVLEASVSNDAAPGSPLVFDAARQRRLVDAALQLIAALHTLHVAGVVHRDVKPANVLVDPAARQVLLADFGLAVQYDDRIARRTVEPYMAGTLGYIAPEQFFGEPPTPACDLYSVGVLMLETMTGQRPQLLGPPQPVVLPSGIDPRLAALVGRLLARDPRARIDARQAHAGLAAIVGRGSFGDLPLPSSLRGRQRRDPFVGRSDPLELLRLAAQRAASGSETVVVHIHGPSGIGKTALCQRFLEVLDAARPPIVLRGRCHPNERLDFCAWDRVVDDLSGLLHRLPRPNISPVGVEALTRLFPALRQSVADAPGLPKRPAGTAELRRTGFEAFRSMLTAVAANGCLIVWLDDLQWTDADSLELLRELLAAGGVPGAIFLLSYRSDDDSEGSPLAALRALGGGGGTVVHRLEAALTPLSHDEARELFRVLTDGPNQDLARNTAPVIGELAGFPILVRELALHTHARATEHIGDPVTLDDLIHSRLEALPQEQQLLVDLISLSPRPVTQAIAARAAGVDGGLHDAFTALRQSGLLRLCAGRGPASMAPYHDQIRDARMHRLPEPTRKELHLRLALAHEALAHDQFDVLGYHWEGAGEASSAAGYLLRAADRSHEKLAFAAAVTHLEKAMVLQPEHAANWTIHERVAECYANLGLSGDAGPRYERAATLTPASVDDLVRIGLRRRAAAELFHCGRVHEGYLILREVLAYFDVRLPASHQACITSSLWLRLRLVMRGLHVNVRAAENSDPRVLALLDVLWAACTSLAHLNHGLADVLLLRHLLLALDVGEPTRLLKSMCYESAAEATLGGPFFTRRSTALLTAAACLLPDADRSYDHGWYWVASASRHVFLSDWPAARHCNEEARGWLQREPFGTTWERAVNSTYHSLALAMTGEAGALAATQGAAVEEARSRRDPLAHNGVAAGHPAILRLYLDDEEGAQREISTALGAERWSDSGEQQRRWPEDSFRTPDYYNLVAHTELLLYQGRACEALLRLRRDWPHLRRALFLHLQFVGIDLRFLHAKCALAAVGEVERGQQPRAWSYGREALLRIARHHTAAVRGDANALSCAYGPALVAALLAHRGHSGRAAVELERAAVAFHRADMRAYREAARLWRARLLGAEAEIDTAAQALRELGAVKPDRLARALLPLSGISRPRA